MSEEGEYAVRIDHGSFVEKSLGLEIDLPTLIVKYVHDEGKIVAWHKANPRRREAVQVGDQVIEVNGRTVRYDGRADLIALLTADPEAVPTLEIRFRRSKTRQRLALSELSGWQETETGPFSHEVIVLDEGQHVDGISDGRFLGQLYSLSDGAGFGHIHSSKELIAALGCKDVPVPSYLVDNPNFAVDMTVSFRVTLTEDGLPRAMNVHKAAKPKIPPPRIVMSKPLPEFVSWTEEMKKHDVQRRRPEHQNNPASRGGKRPALQRRDSAEVGKAGLANVRAGETTLDRIFDEEVHSQPESDGTTESLAGDVSRSTNDRKGRRYLHPQHEALDFSESWRPMAWTREQWENQLKMAGELKPTTANEKFRGALGVAKALYRGLPAKEKERIKQDRTDDLEKPEPELPSTLDADAAGFSLQTQAARDNQTEQATWQLFKDRRHAREVREAIHQGILDTKVVQPVKLPEFKAAELLEAKHLLHGLVENLEANQRRIEEFAEGSRRGRSAGPRVGGYPSVAINGPLYAANPPPSFPAEKQFSRKWL